MATETGKTQSCTHGTSRHICVTLRQMIDKCTNTLKHNIEPFNKVPHILTKKDADLVLLNFNGKKLGIPFDEQILATNPRYSH